MMMGKTELDDLLAAAGQAQMEPSEALIARVLADAEAMQRPLPAALRARAPQPPKGLWQRLVEALGGAGAMAGLGTEVVVGLAFGLLQPTSLSLVTGGYMALENTQTGTDAELFPDMTLFLTEDQG